jgi:peptidoglycan-associated lipoprotein
MHPGFRYFFLFAAISLFLFSPDEAVAQDRRLVRADQAYELQQYSEALNFYRRAYNRVRRKDRAEGLRVIYRTAMCYHYLNDHRRAEAWFRRAVRMNYPDPKAILYLAETLVQNEKLDEALQQFRRYAERVPDDWRGQRGIEAIEKARELMASPTDYQVEAVRILNSREDDYTPAFADHRSGSMVFASGRDDALGRSKDLWTGQQHTSLFITFQDRAGNWSRPALLDEGPVNTEYNEGAPSVNSSGTIMYFTRCVRSPDVSMGCRIFSAERQGPNWIEPREIPLTSDSSVTVGHPAISPNDLELYFVSDMPGSIGTNDIWVVRRNTPNGTFGQPENLGPVINTPGNEMFPYIRQDGTLYFSSDGHPGLGGLDIFMSRKTPEGWTAPENLGVPINSPADDFGITFAVGREQGFFSSNRPGSRGYDIYSFYLAPPEFSIAGIVRDDSTRAVLQNAVIQLVGSDGSLNQVTTNREGRYLFDKYVVRENIAYELLVSRESYFSARGRVSTVNEPASKDFSLDFALAPIPERAIPLPEILYEFAQWELQPQFRDSLNGLVRTLRDNPNIVIELASHTDSRGTDAVNDTLSQRRAQVVVDFLVAQGIERDRLVATGYGKRVPRVIEKELVRGGFRFPAQTVLTETYINSLPTEEHRDVAHQLNRRTEFRVLRDDYEPPEGQEPE